ncbi:MAG: AAA family ATPase [Ilumatobacteraceae bacterium]
MVARGFVGAAYRHRTSRAGDPHLHWHVLVANLAQGIDGRWSALDGRAITTPLVPVALCSRPLCAASSRLQVPADFAAVEADWHTRADAANWGPAELEQLVASAAPATVRSGFVIEDEAWRNGVRSLTTRLVGFDEWLDWLLDHRVTAHDGTFTRFDLTRAVASALPATTSVEVVEATVQWALGSPAVVPLTGHSLQSLVTNADCRVLADERVRMYTSRSLLALEEGLMEQLVGGVDAGVGVLDLGRVDAAVHASALGEDQASAVTSLTAGGDRISVLVGRAGTGKTHTLGTVRALYEDAGCTVVGLAPSARASRELEAGAGICSTTLARHLVEHRDIDASAVVMVDEAGMAAVRDLARESGGTGSSPTGPTSSSSNKSTH